MREGTKGAGQGAKLTLRVADSPEGDAPASPAKDGVVGLTPGEVEQMKDTCMCGGHMDRHTMGDGHAPVSMWDYYQEDRQ